MLEEHTEQGADPQAATPGDSGGGQGLLRDGGVENSAAMARPPAFRNLEIRKEGGTDLENQVCGFLRDLKEARVILNGSCNMALAPNLQRVC